MSWVNAFAGFLVCHMVGDYLFQTDWQARHKRGGLTGDAAIMASPLAIHTVTAGARRDTRPSSSWRSRDLP